MDQPCWNGAILSKLKERTRRRSEAIEQISQEIWLEGLWVGASCFGVQLRRTGKRKEEFGEEKETDTAGMTGRDDLLPLSGFLDDGRVSRQERLIGEASSKARCGGDVIFRGRLLLLLAAHYSSTI